MSNRQLEQHQIRLASKLAAQIGSTNPQAVLVDYFDTLVTRDTSRSQVKTNAARRLIDATGLGLDPASLVEIRQRSERMTSNASLSHGRDEDFDLISVAILMHAELQPTVDIDTFAQATLMAEIAAELSTQRLNRALVDTLLAARQGRQIALVSDFHLPSEWFVRMLKHHRVDGLFASVTVSCDHGLTKRSGRLYPIALAALDGRNNAGPDRFLMIGDNPISDIQNASTHGLSTFEIVSPSDSNRLRFTRVLRRVTGR